MLELLMPHCLLSRRDDSRAGCRFCSHLFHQRPVPRVGMTSTRMYFATLLLFAVTFVLQQQVLAVELASRIMPDSDILQESIVNLINSNPGAGWEADMNPRFFNYSVSQFKHLLGVKPPPLLDLGSFPVKSHPKSLELPSQFDAREAWAHCSNIGKIYDQGHCGSCWAFGAVESLSDRFCIHFGINISLSVNDLLACCGFLCGSGCDGGSPFSAWQYMVTSGVVTESCDPYFDEIGCSHPGCEPLYPTPKCERRCMDKNEPWWESKHYSVDAYKLGSAPRDIMTEVYTNGPVEVSFTVYEDFAHYKSGVYRYVAGNAIGGHAVKLIGWGSTEDGEDYWILVNQWNREWGEDGYFKMRRGTNECGVEEAVVAGLPSTKNLIRRSRAAALESTA